MSGALPTSGPSHERGPRLLALGAALLLAALYGAPGWRAVWASGGTAGIYVGHAETLAASTYGRWWVLRPHHFMNDAFSGDLPTFYNFLSDSLVNTGAVVTRLMPMTFQALVYGPLLGFLFVWVGYLALARATEDRWVAALAAAVAAFSVDPGLAGALRGAEYARALDQLLHVPFHGVGLGNGQSLGFVMFLPVTALLLHARERFTPFRAALHGALLGLLFLVHTLTFINVVAVEAVSLAVRRTTATPRDRTWSAWIMGLGILGAGFAWIAWVRPPHTFATLAFFVAATFALLFATDDNRRFYLWSYLPAVLTMLPYALRLAREWSHMAGRDGDPRSVDPAGLLLFFVLHGAVGVGARRWAPRGPMWSWAVAMLGTNFFFAFNQAWGWGNHPYRFAINLVFPLAIFAGLGLRHAPRLLALPLGAALAIGAIPSAVQLVSNEGLLVRVQSRQRLGAFLEEVRRVTDAETDRGGRILNPPEFRYPEGTEQSALILNASSLRGFVPDYRYVLWPERHRNRLAVFCFLFPAYPHEEMHTNLRACDGSQEPRLFEFVDPRIRAAILPVYGIRYAASIGSPFNFELPPTASEHGWPLLATTKDRHFLFRIAQSPLPGLARLSPGAYDESGFHVSFDVATGGRHRVVIGGRNLEERAPALAVDGKAVPPLTRDGSWLVAESDLAPGAHALALPRANPRWQEESDFVFFLAVIHEASLSRLIRDKTTAPPNPEPGGSPSR